MVISTHAIAGLLRPGLQQVFSSGIPASWDSLFEPPRPIFSADWLNTYKTELRRAQNQRAWRAWLERHKPSVRDRLDDLNPDGVEPGQHPRGWHRKWCKADVWTSDIVSTAQYQKRWGYAPLASAVVKSNGRKKYVTRCAFMDGTAHNPPCLRR